jgi:hypothetical protein
VRILSFQKAPFLLEFELVGLTRMGNASGRSTKFGVVMKEKKELHAHMGRVVDSRYRPPRPIKRAELQLTRFSSSEPDPDGLVSGFKYVVDGLVHLGILTNDKPQNIGFPYYAHEKCKRGQGKLHVVVKALPNDHDHGPLCSRKI